MDAMPEADREKTYEYEKVPARCRRLKGLPPYGEVGGAARKVRFLMRAADNHADFFRTACHEAAMAWGEGTILTPAKCDRAEDGGRRFRTKSGREPGVNPEACNGLPVALPLPQSISFIPALRPLWPVVGAIVREVGGGYRSLCNCLDSASFQGVRHNLGNASLCRRGRGPRRRG